MWVQLPLAPAQPTTHPLPRSPVPPLCLPLPPVLGRNVNVRLFPSACVPVSFVFLGSRNNDLSRFGRCRQSLQLVDGNTYLRSLSPTTRCAPRFVVQVAKSGSLSTQEIAPQLFVSDALPILAAKPA